MGGFTLYITTSVALILVIEGLLYALFPEGVRRFAALLEALPPSRLRFFGLSMALAGAAIIWLLRALS